MKKQAILLCFLMIFTSVILCGCGGKTDVEAGNGDLTEVTFVLDWTPNPNRPGVYVAQEKGWIKEEGKADVIPAQYASHGASAISILTDEKYFGGHLSFIEKARPMVDIPILRKEFIIDEYQLFQARAVQADAVLLIAAELTLSECRQLIRMAHELSLEVLLEIHGEKELDYCDLEADMIGVNNRDLGTFHTTVDNSFAMISKLPSDRVLVSESGISNPETVRLLREIGYRGFLMGEHFMRYDNPGEALAEFISAI